MTRLNDHGQPVGKALPGWTPRPRPARVGLVGRWVRLEPVTVDHADALFAALCGAEDDPLWTYRTTERPASVAALAEQLVVAAQDDTTVTFAVVPDGEQAAGLLTLMRVDPGNGVIEVGSIIFAGGLQRTRAATEALVLVIRHVLDELAYRRLEWKCDSLNEPSRAAAARLGFRYEGRFRQAVVHKGRNRDTDWFAVTDEDWPALAAAYDEWLAPENFDSTGRQRRRLGGLTAS